MRSSHRPLLSGVYAASLTFYNDAKSELDRSTQREHTRRLGSSGIAGFVVMGSNGEAPHLSNDERIQIVQDTRSVLDSLGKEQIPIIAGCSEQSLQGTVRLCREAAAAGSDYALVLPPSYFRGAMSTDVIESFFFDVAEQSPIPILLYSFPAVSAGIELDSDLLIRVSKHHNVAGTKFTCGDTGKLSRVASMMKHRPDYVTFGGLADFILPAIIAGADGVIAGGANVTPRVCVEVLRLWHEGKIAEAQALQVTLANGDWEHTVRGISGTKAALNKFLGYGGDPRQPLRPLSDESTCKMMKGMEQLLALETSLALRSTMPSI